MGRTLLQNPEEDPSKAESVVELGLSGTSPELAGKIWLEKVFGDQLKENIKEMTDLDQKS